MKPLLLVHTFEVMAMHPSGELRRLHYPGSPDRAREYSTLFEANQFLQKHWPNYARYNSGEPVVVKRS